MGYCVWHSWVACPPRGSEALVLGTFGEGMRMKTSSPETWRREVLESHLGLSRGTTLVRKNVRRPGPHHRLAEDYFKLHCAKRYRALCPTAATAEVVAGDIVFIKGGSHGHWCGSDGC